MGKDLWIIKPGENTNRGCGITVCRELQQIRQIISNLQGVNGKQRSYIIQKYCEKPLLYKSRKFDIRCFALTSVTNGNLQAYFYSDGYLRTSCREYNIKNVQNRLIHLTNDAVQNRCADYGKFENGNKVSFVSLIARVVVVYRVPEVLGRTKYEGGLREDGLAINQEACYWYD